MKILNKVTVTGADDSVKDIEELREIQKEFPFVEWGILLSASSAGTNRFPSQSWIWDLIQNSSPSKEHIIKHLRFNLAGHICGRWIREICTGE